MQSWDVPKLYAKVATRWDSQQKRTDSTEESYYVAVSLYQFLTIFDIFCDFSICLAEKTYGVNTSSYYTLSKAAVNC